jgi:cell division inhibitor SulA/protein ImuA
MGVEGLTQLLRHPAIWQGANAAQTDAISTGFVATGFAALDDCLPGNGWPRSGLIEILIPRLGSGELYLLMPVLAALTKRESARWCAWVAPPYQPFAPALVAHGVALERVLVVRAHEPSWAFEQALGLGACDVALAWAHRLAAQEIRRLQLAAQRGRALGVLFRRHQAAHESSSAQLRVMLEPAGQGARLTLLKSRGGRREPIQLSWNEAHAFRSM